MGNNVFREEENYHYFLKRYAHYIYPVAETYAFCLLPNHFHLLVGIREEEELSGFFRSQGKDLLGFENLAGLVSKQFSHFFNGYAKAFNKKYARKGKLFRKDVKRKAVRNAAYYKNVIAYIHQNPVRHGFVDHPVDWPFCSYPIMLSRKATQVERDSVLGWFGGRKAFVEFHRQISEIKKDEFY